jgi:hypothetical protein
MRKEMHHSVLWYRSTCSPMKSYSKCLTSVHMRLKLLMKARRCLWKKECTILYSDIDQRASQWSPTRNVWLLHIWGSSKQPRVVSNVWPHIIHFISCTPKAETTQRSTFYFWDWHWLVCSHSKHGPQLVCAIRSKPNACKIVQKEFPSDNNKGSCCGKCSCQLQPPVSSDIKTSI